MRTTAFPEHDQGMETTRNTPIKTTSAFFAQAAISFGVSVIGLLWAVLYLPIDPWQRGFIAMTSLFLVSSTFTLAKVVRDKHEEQNVVSRIDQARVERILAEHDPFRSVA